VGQNPKRGVVMKYLNVNPDDFGACRGVNRGVIEAHRQSILASASLLVKAPWRNEAAALSRTAPELSCHPGYDDPGYSIGFAAEPETELRKLCSPRIREVLAEQSIQLIICHDRAKLLASAAT